MGETSDALTWNPIPCAQGLNDSVLRRMRRDGIFSHTEVVGWEWPLY